MTMLDPGAREAARLWAINAASDGGVPGDDYIDGILTAYLSTITPAEVAGLVERLREGTFGSDITKTDAYLNGLMRQAATALAAKDAELAAVHQRYVDANEARIDAEARLAEANKALDEIANAKTELTSQHDYSRGWNDALARVRQIARRAREAQGGENG